MPVHSITTSMLRISREFLGIAFGQHFDRPAADVDAVACNRHLAREAAVHAVMAQEVRVVFGGEQVIDGDDFDVLAIGFHNGAQDVAADTAETGNCYSDGHWLLHSLALHRWRAAASDSDAAALWLAGGTLPLCCLVVGERGAVNTTLVFTSAT